MADYFYALIIIYIKADLLIINKKLLKNIYQNGESNGS